MRRTRWNLSLTALACLAVGTSSVAEAGNEIAVLATGVCPSRDAVVSALAEAMPDATILGDAAAVHADSETIRPLARSPKSTCISFRAAASPRWPSVLFAVSALASLAPPSASPRDRPRESPRE